MRFVIQIELELHCLLSIGLPFFNLFAMSFKRGLILYYKWLKFYRFMTNMLTKKTSVMLVIKHNMTFFLNMQCKKLRSYTLMLFFVDNALTFIKLIHCNSLIFHNEVIH